MSLGKHRVYLPGQKPGDVMVKRRCTGNNTHLIALYSNKNIGRGSGGLVRDRGGKRIRGASRSRLDVAEAVGVLVGRQLRRQGLSSVHVHFQGRVSTRRAACRGLRGVGIRILTRTDLTPRPHGGCRPKKARRL